MTPEKNYWASLRHTQGIGKGSASNSIRKAHDIGLFAMGRRRSENKDPI
jgi:hypothetical protein